MSDTFTDDRLLPIYRPIRLRKLCRKGHAYDAKLDARGFRVCPTCKANRDHSQAGER